MSASLSENLSPYLAERFPGARISDFQFLTSGWESDVYTFTLHLPPDSPQNFILRLFPGDSAVSKMEREAEGLRRLRQCGYPVPALLLYETDSAPLGKPFTLLEKLDGEPLWPVLARMAPAEGGWLLERFSSLLAQLHQLDWQAFTDQAEQYKTHPYAPLDELFARFREAYVQFDVPGFLAIFDWLEEHKQDIVVQPAVVHLDFHANNVFLCDDGHLAVIDWTQIAVSDFRLDLSWTLMLMGDFGQTGWAEQILRAYSLATDHPVEALDYFNVIVYTKLLAVTVISLRASPSEMGMRSEELSSLQEQAPLLERLARRIQNITGITVPEVEALLAQARDPYFLDNKETS